MSSRTKTLSLVSRAITLSRLSFVYGVFSGNSFSLATGKYQGKFSRKRTHYSTLLRVLMWFSGRSTKVSEAQTFRHSDIQAFLRNANITFVNAALSLSVYTFINHFMLSLKSSFYASFSLQTGTNSRSH